LSFYFVWLIANSEQQQNPVKEKSGLPSLRACGGN